jgi:hypothetical protein
MRAVDLAVYADTLAAESATLSARLERARQRMRQAAIEDEARRDLAPETVSALERLGILERRSIAPDVRDAAEAALGLEALEALQAWVESRLRAARLERQSTQPTRGGAVAGGRDPSGTQGAVGAAARSPCPDSCAAR